jgi:NADH-quinone oxidoreductase subunit G
MAEELVTIHINDAPVQVRKGAMLIEAADAQGIAIPRFCYHRKLSVAANCRMCLVEQERAPKPVPACATPVMEGQKFWTRSEKVRKSQQAVMEFLLINHPLDCPICDQGGECELQDVAVGYGGSTSQFAEIKRVVRDKDIGPLIETEMTRCIQCTRCVRFGTEIAGMREMGGTGRGDRLEIGTFIEKSLHSELSGNIIDLCPVGALTAKPSRYSARAWEMKAYPSVAPHDSVGSNLEIHVARKKVVRCVPRENESVNECWISDRDRFSYQGATHSERLTKPMLKRDGQWYEVSWQQALEAVVEALRNVGPAQIGALANATSTVEELYLFQRLMRGLNVRNIDHRLRQTDFSDQTAAPVMPYLGMKIAEVEQVNAALLIGANVRYEQPLLNYRLRKASLNGAQLFALNPCAYDFNYEIQQQAVAPSEMVATLQAMLADANHSAMQALKNAPNAAVWLGNIAVQHPEFAQLRALASQIATQTGAKFGYFAENANTNGAWLAGVVPHRLSIGRELKQQGLSCGDMLKNAMRAWVLLNTELADFANPQQAMQALTAADHVVVIAPFADEAARQYATVLLPGSVFSETAGTFVNAEGVWQSFRGAVEPPVDARPTWKILRVLGNTFGIPEFDWGSAEEVAAELRIDLHGVDLHKTQYRGTPARQAMTVPAGSFQRVGEVTMYRSDALVRRAAALQAMVEPACVRLHPQDAEKLGVAAGERVQVTQAGIGITLPVQCDAAIPRGCAGVAAGLEAVDALGDAFGTLQITRAG